MKVHVYTGAQMKMLDGYAIEHCNISGKQLMYNAAQCMAEEMQKRIELAKKTCVIVCGRGNNGGDGFAVATLLSVRCAQVRVVCLEKKESLSPDAAYYRAQVQRAGMECIELLDEALSAIEQADVLVDALYGFGFRGALEDADARLVEAMNASRAFTVSADIPSGVSADEKTVNGVCVQADLTVTFTGYKLSATLFESWNYYGEIAVADIGIPQAAKEKIEPCAVLVSAKTAQTALGKRRRDMHKGDCGKIFVLGGSRGMSGAVYMSATAALKSGAGLVCAGVPECIADIMEIKTTEVMTLALAQEGEGPDADAAAVGKANEYDATAFGMGAGRLGGVKRMLEDLIRDVKKPLLIDADGLYALAQNPDALLNHTQTLVLTPHSGEMARLCNISVQEVEADRLACARNFAKKYNVYVVLKGAHTVIASPNGDAAINCIAGNSGMATAGSGDVLSGICALMLSRGANAFEALQAAVYIHALAGDMAANVKGEDGMTACDIIEMLPFAIQEIRQKQ